MTSFRSVPLAIVGALFIFCCGVWSVVYAESPHSTGQLILAVLDVGQGDALYIESPTGVQLLIDGGPDGAVLGQLPELMPALDRSLDAVIATHPDADHIGGLSDVLERYGVGAYITPGIPKSTQTAKRLEAKASEKEIPRIAARAGMTLDLGGGAYLEILYPDRDVSHLPDSRSNDGCVVARLVYGSTSALLACDAPGFVEEHLAAVQFIDSDVLKVAHHGSKYSSAPDFIAAVSPEVAVISVGGGNSYGHPTAQTLSTLKAAGAEILRTDENGTVRCVSDGAGFSCF